MKLLLLKARVAYLGCTVFAAMFALSALSSPVVAYEQQGEHEGQYGDDDRDSDNDGEPNCEDDNDGNDADGDGRDQDDRDNDSDNWWNCEDDDDGYDTDGDGADDDNNDADNDGEENCEDDNDGIDFDGDGYDNDTRVMLLFPQGGDENDGEGAGAGSCTVGGVGTGDWLLLAGALTAACAAAGVRRRKAPSN